MLKEGEDEERITQPSKELKEDSMGSIEDEDGTEHSNEGEEGSASDSFKLEDSTMSDEEGEESPLTRAKLLAFAEMGEPWLPVGDGVVSVKVTIESSNAASEGQSSGPSPAASGGKVGKVEEEINEITSGLVSQRVGRLEVVDLDNPEEVLLSTPIDVDGDYQIRDDNIIMWNDAQLGRSLAFQFTHTEGCRKILGEITDFQQSELSKRDTTADAEPLLVSGGTPPGKVGGGKTGAADGSGSPGARHKFAVSVGNLRGILDAVQTNPLIFGSYVREDMTYFRQLAELFDESRERGDTESMERIAQITLNLLNSPYNSEGKILAQFMESAYVDRCVDIVQYALGRKDKASGFVSFEERRATFKDPLHLPEPVLQRIHLLYSALYLRDLLPLSLDDGDGGSPCVLNLLLLRFKFSLISEICTKQEFLPQAFKRAEGAAPDKEGMYALAAFVQDMANMIKNGPISFEAKEELFNAMFQGGLLAFCRNVLFWGLQDVATAQEEEARAASTTTSKNEDRDSGAMDEPMMRKRSDAEKAVEACCDVLSHSLFVVPSARDTLKAETETNPKNCSLALVMRCLTLLRHSSALQAAYDVVLGAAIGVQALQVFQSFMNLGAQRAIMRFWVEGSGVESPPLYLVATHLATLLNKVESCERPLRVLVWSHGEELQLMYGFRVLNAVAEKVEEGFRTSFADILELSKILEGCRRVMAQAQSRRLENVQSSVVSFLTRLISMGNGNIMKLLDEAPNSEADQRPTEKSCDTPRGLLSVCMSLLLACSRRNSILSASLGAMFVNLCTEVHHEKLQVAEAASISPSSLRPSFVTPMDGSNPLPPEVANAHRDESAQCRYQKAAAGLVTIFGEQLDERSPVVAEKLRASISETPEEAKLAEAETSSLPSTIGRPGDGLSDFDALAMDFGLDLAVPVPASRSPSASNSPLSEAAVAASEDSLLSELADWGEEEDEQTETESNATDSDDEPEDAPRWKKERKDAQAGGGDSPVPPPTLDTSSSSSSSSNSSNEKSTENSRSNDAAQDADAEAAAEGQGSPAKPETSTPVSDTPANGSPGPSTPQKTTDGENNVDQSTSSRKRGRSEADVTVANEEVNDTHDSGDGGKAGETVDEEEAPPMKAKRPAAKKAKTTKRRR